MSRLKTANQLKSAIGMDQTKAAAIHEASQNGEKPTQIAKDYGVSRATVYRLAKEAA